MAKADMLKGFAHRAGVRLVKMKLADGGPIGYTEKDAPFCVVGGFRTADAAYTHWLQNTFGQFAARAVLNLLRRVDSRAAPK